MISKERNPVVEARCKKMKVNSLQSIDDKAVELKRIMAERGIKPEEVIYMGNDTNDLPCFPVAGFAVAPSDAQKDVLRRADLVLGRAGGHGAVRELCDILMSRLQ